MVARLLLLLVISGATAFIHGPLAAVRSGGSPVTISGRTHAHSLSRLSMVEKVKVEPVTIKTKTPSDTKKVASSASASTSELIESANEVFNKVKSAVKDVNAEDLKDDAMAVVEGVKKSLSEGEFGTRGEALLAAQLGLILLILVGDIPVVGGLVEFLAGPGLLFGGLALAAAGVLQLGSKFSPLMPPAEGALLRTTGVYSFCRHPSYAGLIMFGLGLGFSTDSFVRVALSLLLGYVLDKKASEEEKLLMDKFPAYSTYKEEVAKFIPKLY